MFFGQAPDADAGEQVSLPYIVLTDDGRYFESQSDHGGHSTGLVMLDVYDYSLADIAQTINAFRYNGQQPDAAAGLDFCVLDLTSPIYHISLTPEEETYSFSGLYREGKRIHQGTVTYRVTVGLGAKLASV